MSKVSRYTIAVLSILLAYSVYQILTYQTFVSQIAWSIDTLYLNVKANRAQWKACEFRGNNT